MHLKSEVPSDFTGVPTANAQKMWFFPYQVVRKGFELEALWNLFRAIHSDYDPSDAYSKCLTILSVKDSKITQGLFWADPERFFPVDVQTIPFLRSHGIIPDTSTWASYIKLLGEIKSKFHEPFYELSSMAYRIRNEGDINNTTPKYWLAGSTYNEQDDQLGRFLREGIWENGFDHKYTDLTKSVKNGDKIAIKSTFTRGSRGNTIGYGKIKARGVVRENPLDGQKLYVDWDLNFEPFEHIKLSSYRKTLQELNDQEIIDMVFKNDKSKEENKIFALNTILYGPPGSGKTYSTIDRAVSIIDGNSAGSHEDNKERFDELRSEGLIEFITFHQNYSYEDFVIGLRPEPVAQTLKFERVSGIFMDIATRARENWERWKASSLKEQVYTKPSFEEVFDSYFQELIRKEVTEVEIKMRSKSFRITGIDFDNQHIKFKKASGGTGHDLVIPIVQGIYEGGRNYRQDGLGIYYYPLVEALKEHSKQLREPLPAEELRKYVLIIDEINRANISRVFGELITLLEEDKRLGGENELRVTLPGGINDFGVPPNLYIIGTMNTADKSIALVDIALRRRFEFVGMYPTAEVLDELVKNAKMSESGQTLLQTLNNGIFKKKNSADFLIGHAYLIGKLQDAEIEEVIRKKIIPLLMEYFSGRTKDVSELFENSGWKVNYNVASFDWEIEQV
ncbi:MAG: AAA family ATPase [Saprospiraceae bacterium]|nr:AAA family ATPase [Saprospiraceae bacterium]